MDVLGWIHRQREGHAPRWRAGELSDAEFERAQVWRVWKVFGVLLGPIALVSVAGLLSEGKELSHALGAGGLILLMGAAVAFRMAQLNKASVRDMVLAKQRAFVEQNPGVPMTCGPAVHSAVALYGQYPRTVKYALNYLKLVALLNALVAWLGYNYGVTGGLLILGFCGVIATLAGLYMLADRRVYVDISAEGVWCRAWGPTRLAYTDFKAVYPRQKQRLIGVALVPQDLAALKRKLSWFGRLALRNSGSSMVGTAHVGTLSIWSVQLGLSQAALLSGLQAEIVNAVQAQPVNKPHQAASK